MHRYVLKTGLMQTDQNTFFEPLLLALLLVLLPKLAIAVSFSADAVQIRNGQFSHARMYWQDDKVRFEYVEDGVPMVQIFDNEAGKMIWLDTENKRYLEKKLLEGQAMDAMVRQSQPLNNPCTVFEKAECIKLKKTEMHGRQAQKWLITFNDNGHDRHMFQWIDSKLGVVLRQENPDGSVFDVSVQENQEINGRKVTKLEMHAISATGMTMQGSQWIDEKLNIVVRQQNDAGAMDELRNIKIEKLDAGLFAVPGNYSRFESEPPAATAKAAVTESVNKQ